MLKQLWGYLSEIGLSDIQIHLYEFILRNITATINEIKEALHYSYAQVNYNMSVLEEKGLIFSSKGKDKQYHRIDPKIALNRILEDRYKRYQEQINALEEYLKAEESERGACYKHLTFYHYSDVNLAMENIIKLIKNAREEICMSSLPPTFLKNIEGALHEAYLRGVKIELYYSTRDFIEITNYFELITNILRRIRLTIIETEEKTCQLLRYNDIIANNGILLIDDLYFNSIIYLDENFFHFNGFTDSHLVKTVKKFLRIKTVMKRVKMEHPESVKRVINIIQENEGISTSEIGLKSKISGTKLREILDSLLAEGIIKETKSKSTMGGKPRKEYSFIKN